MRTALYIRFSSERQKHGVSLRDQLQRLERDAQLAGEEIVETFIDQARSGTTVRNRAEYQRLLAFVRAGGCDIVRMESVDRGHRNDAERRDFEATLARAGVRIVYSGETPGQAPEQQQFNRGIKGLVAELESGQISQRTYDRQLYRAKQGRRRGGSAHYGLLMDGAWYRPDPETYETLIWILEQRAQGKGYMLITKLLNQGIGDPPAIPPTPAQIAWRRKPYIERQDPLTGDIVRDPRPRSKGIWNQTTIRHICREAAGGVYAGIVTWGKLTNKYREDRYGNRKEPVRVETGRLLIPADLIDRVRATELSRQGIFERQKLPKGTFLMTLRCSECGNLYRGATSTTHRGGAVYKYRVYLCDGRTVYSGCCTMPRIREHRIDRAVVSLLIRHLADTGAMRAALTVAIGRHRGELERTAASLDQQVTDLTADQARALDVLLRTDLTSTVLEALNHRLNGIAARLADLGQQREVIGAALATLDQRARSIDALITDNPLTSAALDTITEVATIKRLQPAVAALVEEATVLRVETGVQIAVKIRTVEGLICQFGSSMRMYTLELTETIPVRWPKKPVEA